MQYVSATSHGGLRPCSAAFLLSLAFVIGACTTSSSGRVAARGTGEVSDTPAPRSPFDGAMIDACGSGDLTEAGASALGRAPYLQRVGTDRALVLWTAHSADPMRVRITTPDGSEVLTTLSQLDPTASGVKQHVATLEGLEPSTTYCYQVSAGDRPLTELTGFRTAPARGSGEPVQFVVWGDSGSGGADQGSVLGQVMETPFDLILHTGDVAYEDGTLSQFEQNFFDVYAPLLRSIPAFPTSGNHDYRTSDAAPFRQVFALPDNGGTGGVERWYSFDWGDVHFVALDTQKIASAQIAWLEADLAATDAPWIIAYAHKGPWSSGEHGNNESFQSHFAPILERHRVSLVLSGHDHDYERIMPKNGVTYVVTGGGGKSTRPVGTHSWTAFSEDVLHFVWARVTEDELTLHAIDATGREFDSTRIARTR